MDFFRRAITNVIRKPGKTVTLLVLIFILANIISGTLSIRQAINNTESALLAKIRPVATITEDTEKLMHLFQQNQEFLPETIPAETLEKIGSLPYVKYFDYSSLASLESSVLQRCSFIEGYYSDGVFNYFSFQGVNNPQLIDLQEGVIKLVSGRIFSEQEVGNLSYVALVSQNLADTNNLSVGSKIVFDNNVYDYSSIENNQVVNNVPDIVASQKYEFEIIGIFEPVKKPGSNTNSTMTMDSVQMIEEELNNRIYAPNKVLNEATAYQMNESIKLNPEYAKYADQTYYNNLYVLNAPQDLTAFKDEVAALVPDYYKVADTSESINQVAAPMKSMQGIASVILYTAVGATLIILSLLITLFIRDRKQEIGIYFSLGERKKKIAAQVVLEVAVIAVIAITLALFSGNILAGSISEKMLTDQIAADLIKTEEGLNSGSAAIIETGLIGYQNDIGSEDVLLSYAVTFNLTTILLFYAIGIGTVCVSTLIPIIYTLRLNPKRIMM